jgi:L-iditol 2-dehydrogenase
MTEGRGADISFEVVGITPTVNLALNLIRRGGSAVFVGNLAPKVEFPLQIAVTRELTIYGSTGSSGEYPICIDLIARGIVRVEPMMSAVAPLEEGRAWFERLSAKDGGSKYMKVVLQP